MKIETSQGYDGFRRAIRSNLPPVQLVPVITLNQAGWVFGTDSTYSGLGGFDRQIKACMKEYEEHCISEHGETWYRDHRWELYQEDKSIYGLVEPRLVPLDFVKITLSTLAEMKGQVTFDELFEAINENFGHKYGNKVIIENNRKMLDDIYAEERMSELLQAGVQRINLSAPPYTSETAFMLAPLLICMALPENVLRETNDHGLPKEIAQIEKYMGWADMKRIFSMAADTYFVEKLLELGFLNADTVDFYLENIGHFLLEVDNRNTKYPMRHLSSFEAQEMKGVRHNGEIISDMRLLPAFVFYALDLLSNLPKNVKRNDLVSPSQLEEYYRQSRGFILRALSTQENGPMYKDVYDVCKEGLAIMAELITFYLNNPEMVNKVDPDWNREARFPSVFRRIEEFNRVGARSGSGSAWYTSSRRFRWSH